MKFTMNFLVSLLVSQQNGGFGVVTFPFLLFQTPKKTGKKNNTTDYQTENTTEFTQTNITTVTKRKTRQVTRYPTENGTVTEY